MAVVLIIFAPLLPNIYAGGPRLDYDERYEDIPGAPECWVDGYDAGFAGVYDKDRANECNDIPGDQYNSSWPHGCKDRGLTEVECNDIRNDPDDIDVNHESLQEQNRRDCYDGGFEDGKISNSFNKDRDSACSEYGNAYENGFSAGCQSVEGNTNDSCELTIEGHEVYCRDRPDDPACTEFLHDPSNKKPAETGSPEERIAVQNSSVRNLYRMSLRYIPDSSFINLETCTLFRITRTAFHFCYPI